MPGAHPLLEGAPALSPAFNPTSNPAPSLTAVDPSMSSLRDSRPPPRSKFGTTTIEVASGLSAGFVTTLVTHPLDLVKVRLQLDSTSHTHRQGIQKIYTDILRHASLPSATGSTLKMSVLIRDYYRGITPNLIGSATAWGLYFSLYREFKFLSLRHLRQTDALAQLSTLHYLACAFAAGGTTSFVTNPIWVLKTRMLASNKGSPGAYASVLDGCRRILHEEGIRGFWKGLTPALISVSQGALQFTIYDTIKATMFAHPENQQEAPLTTLQYIYTSATSKMISSIALYPFQVIRSRLQVYRDPLHPPVTMRSVFEGIRATEGLFGFYKGLGPNLVRVVPATCITFVMYEKMRWWLQS